jgi:hypothetical protein
MERTSLKQQIALMSLAVVASISTFTLMVLAPIVASGGLA